MKADSSDNPDFANGALEIYDYPGGYTDTSAGIDYARAWLEGLRAADNRIRAAGDCVSASPGALVTLKDHPIASQNEEYLILRCHHNFTTQDYRSEMQIEGEPPYDGTYELLRADQPVSPPVVTPRPRVHGAQTAKVVGQDEIDVDEHGRIKVQFHWDRKNDYSRRVRLAQVWAGNQWGAMFIPRVGMEVVVDFLEGDPDHPLVIGTVYNGQNKPPYDLPGQKNTAGWKSNSTIGGGGYNEYVFDDTKGQELIRQHGQKDLESVVENDESWTIGRNRSTTIGNNESRSVGNNRRTTIGNSDTLEVGTSLTIKAGSKVTIEVGGPGGSKITITPVSITMESLEIRAKATARFSTTTVLSEHSAAALMDIKGALVKINS
jgi:type VI secretion system secreted protein VgrG